MLGLLATVPVQLTFVASVPDTEEHDAYSEAIERWHAQQDEVRVQLVPWRWRGTAVHDAYTRMLALGDPTVDVVVLDIPWIPEFAWPGWLLPLDDAVGDEIGQFVPAAVEGGRFRGDLYGLPLSLKGNALFYRSDWLDAAGVRPPRSLDELEGAAEALRDEAEVPIALHGPYLYNDVLPLWWASGGGLERDGLPIVDHPRNAMVLDRLASWRADGLAPSPPGWQTDYRAPDDAFVDGRAAFLVAWSPLWAKLRRAGMDDQVGVAPVPGLDPGPGSSNLGTWYAAVNAASRHPDEAAAFVRYFTSPEVQRLFLERLGEIPSRTELLDDRGLREAYPELEVFRRILPRGRVRPRVPNEREIAAILEPALHAAVDGEGDPEALLADASARIEAAWIDDEMPQPSPPVLLADEPVRPSGRSWWWPLVVGVASCALLVVGGVLGGRRLRGSITTRLAWSGSLAVLGVALLQGALALSLVLREQLGELDEERRFYREQLLDTARRVGRDLSLAASVIQDVDDSGEGVVQLLLASHFSEDLVYLELLGVDGTVLHDADDVLMEPGGGTRPPDPEGVHVRRVVLQERDDPAGKVVEVVAPVFQHGVHAGAVRAGISEARYREQLARTQERHDAAVLRFVLGALVLTIVVTLLAIAVMLRLADRLTAPIVQLTRDARRIRGGDLDVRVGVTGDDEVGQLARTMDAMVRGLRDRDRIKDAFGRYLSPELADRFLADPEALQLGGQRQTVTILMSDLRGFTALSARLGPEGTVALLNRYLGCMTDVIVAHGGTIDEFLGDAILVLFGAPFASDDDAARALTCAVRMQQAMVELNAENDGLGLPQLEMGIGLCTGEVVAGNIGSPQRVKYGVVGTPVNLAARIEGLTVGTQVLADGPTLRASGLDLDVWGPMAVVVKGRVAPLEVYEVRGLSDTDRVPVAAEADPVDVDWPVRVQRVVGERIDPQDQEGRAVRSSGRRLALALPEPPPAFSDIVITVDFGDGGPPSGRIHARVARVDPDATIVEVTSAPEDDRARLARLTAAAGTLEG